MDFKTLLKEKEFVLLDGGMGTLIQKSGAHFDRVPEELNITEPELITSIHKSYIDAGSDIIYANTFGANSYKLLTCKYTVQEVVPAAVANARKAAEGTDALAALDIGPIGQLLEPSGALSFDDAYEYFKELILAGKGADLIVLETMTDLYELKAAILAAKENTSLPVLATMTFEKNGRTFTGVSPAAFAVTASGLGADAIGVNCSLGPDELEPIVAELRKYTDLPLVVKPNAGLPDPSSSEYSILPPEFADSIAALLPYGVKICGGCCGTTPEYIKEIAERLGTRQFIPAVKTAGTVVSSSSTAIEIDGPRIIGERINPTGKKLFKQALLDNDIDYVLNQALSQTAAGAEILDVNVGLPGIDEKEMMIRVIKAIQSVSDAPLQIDSTKPDVIEAGLRHYNGKPIVNSVNGEEKSLDSILPLVKKYGASVVGLTLDENGIPKTADERFAIAERIVKKAEEYGIPREDVYIDCLTLTVSAEQDAAAKTLEGLHRVKEELGCRTILGVSNISFGLPYRELVNRTFLTMALEEGLDLPIMNPNVESMTGAVRAFRVLKGIDKNSLEYIEKYKDTVVAVSTSTAAQPGGESPKTEMTDIYKAVYNGIEKQGAKATEAALQSGADSMDIVNNELIPALDKVGDDFEKNRIFLPQLIQSANAAQACFEVIKKAIAENGGGSVSKGRVILATVKGDIHDIGKNIVKVLMDNYGYSVLDLGRDVPPELIVKTAVEQNITAVGLSALMTTSLGSMEETIKLIRSTPELQNPDGSSKVKVLVGGAVVTEDYAKQIGADYYCADAKTSVDKCREIFG